MVLTSAVILFNKLMVANDSSKFLFLLLIKSYHLNHFQCFDLKLHLHRWVQVHLNLSMVKLQCFEHGH